MVKRGLSRILYASGLTRLMFTKYKSKRSFILMYHRIISDRSTPIVYPHSGMVVEEKTFNIQMKYLKKNFKVLPLGDLVNSLKDERENGRIKCSITFDDGWKDNFDYAFPILLKYGLPATIFLTTRYVNSFKWFWYDKLIFLIDKLFKSENPKKIMKLLPYNLSVELTDIPEKMKDPVSFLDSLIEKVKEFPSQERDDLLDKLSTLTQASLHENEQNRCFLNWEEIYQMHSKNISFGAHGASHESLSRLKNQQIEEEIIESKKEIETHLGDKVEGFCYPDGSYNSEVITILKRHGFQYACTTEPGFNGPETDLFQLRRISIHNDISDNIPLFTCRISGLL